MADDIDPFGAPSAAAILPFHSLLVWLWPFLERSFCGSLGFRRPSRQNGAMMATLKFFLHLRLAIVQAARVAESTPNPELLHSLRRLARGLSCLFWGLPLALLVCVRGVQTDLLGRMGVVPPLLATSLLLFGTWQIGAFQRQERIWTAVHGRAQLIALFNLGLSPFLYWCNQVPGNEYFAFAALLFNLGGLMFLTTINTLLERLGAMLPDETLRAETRLFTAVNRWLILISLVLALIFFYAIRSPDVFSRFPHTVETITQNRSLLILPFILIALAMSMALLWKTKEVILESVFGGHH